MSLVQCFLVWDCHGVQVIPLIDNALFCTPRPEISGTIHEGESAFMLFGIFLQLLKLCGAIQNLGRSSHWNRQYESIITILNS